MDLRQLQQEYLDNLRKVTEEKLEIGTLIRTVISIDEGLVFKDGRKDARGTGQWHQLKLRV